MNVQESLAEAIKLGIVTTEQVKSMIAKYKEEEMMEILDQIISDQMSSGRQCIGDSCSI